jgi:hypothetical protein
MLLQPVKVSRMALNRIRLSETVGKFIVKESLHNTKGMGVWGKGFTKTTCNGSIYALPTTKEIK